MAFVLCKDPTSRQLFQATRLLRFSPMKQTIIHLICVVALGAAAFTAPAQDAAPTPTSPRWSDNLLTEKPAWFASAAARAIADSVIQYQSSQGGWPKSTDLAKPPQSPADIPPEGRGRANSLDNGATTTPMEFLARVIHATGETKYKDSFIRGLDYLFAAQYPNGGWPQFYPLREGYYSHITFNDDAMIHVMELLRDVASGQTPYEFVDAERRAKAGTAVSKGIDCILKTQIKQNGKLTVWCAQYDEKTLEPAWARNYEIPSLSGDESVGIVRFLMAIEKPTPEIIAAVEAAVAWFKTVQINGLSYHRGMAADGQRDGSVKPDPTAGPLWARFYELGSNRPLFVDRDKVFNYDYEKVGRERRGGYDYYGHWATSLLAKEYPRWRKENRLP